MFVSFRPCTRCGRCAAVSAVIVLRCRANKMTETWCGSCSPLAPPSNCSALCLRWDVDLKSLRAKSRTQLLFLDRRKQSGSKHISANGSCEMTRLQCLAPVSLFVLPEFATKQRATWQLCSGSCFLWQIWCCGDIAGRRLVAGELNRVANTTN